jgi:hypothetical protein
LKAVREKNKITYKGKPIKITEYFKRILKSKNCMRKSISSTEGKQF